MNITELTARQLRRAAEVKERIEYLREQLAEVFSQPETQNPKRTTRHKWSAAQRRKFVATMRQRGHFA